MSLQSGWVRAGLAILVLVLVSAVVHVVQDDEEPGSLADPEGRVSETLGTLEEGERAYYKRHGVYTAHYTDLLVTGRYSEISEGLLDPGVDIEIDLATNGKAVTIVVTHQDPALRGYVTLDRDGVYGSGGYGGISQ